MLNLVARKETARLLKVKMSLQRKCRYRVYVEVCGSSVLCSLRNRKRKLYLFTFTMKEGRRGRNAIAAVTLRVAFMSCSVRFHSYLGYCVWY